MLINKFLSKCHMLTGCFYENSKILQNLDNMILFSILSVFVTSTFAQSVFIAIFAIIAIFLTIIKLLVKNSEKFEYNTFEIFLTAYFMLTIISLFGSTMFSLSLHGFQKIAIYIGFYISTAHYLKENKNKIWWILLTIGGCIFYETIQGLMQSIIRPDEISTWQDVSRLSPEQIMSRVYGTLKPLNPNLLGGYMVACIPILMGITAHEFYFNRLTNGILMSLVSILSIYVLFSTGCRGSYIGFIAIFITLIILSRKFFNKQYLNICNYITGFATILISVFILSSSSLRSRLLSIFAMRADSSNSFRFNVYNSCLEMLRDNWLLGIGLGNQNFREIYGLYMKTGFDALSAYNIYLETAVESGIFALIAFIGFLYYLLKYAYKFIVESNDTKHIIFTFTAFLSIVGMLVHGLVDTVFFRPQIHFIFWTMTAIIKVLTQENINQKQD